MDAKIIRHTHRDDAEREKPSHPLETGLLIQLEGFFLVFVIIWMFEVMKMMRAYSGLGHVMVICHIEAEDRNIGMRF